MGCHLLLRPSLYFLLFQVHLPLPSPTSTLSCPYSIVQGIHLKSTVFLSLTWCSSSLLLWRRQWHPTPVLLLGKSHGRSLVGCSPWGRLELDTTERLHFHFSLSCIGERNGNPLQCSCLENPRDRGAWWAAVYGVAESDTTDMT